MSNHCPCVREPRWLRTLWPPWRWNCLGSATCLRERATNDTHDKPDYTLRVCSTCLPSATQGIHELAGQKPSKESGMVSLTEMKSPNARVRCRILGSGSPLLRTEPTFNGSDRLRKDAAQLVEHLTNTRHSEQLKTQSRWGSSVIATLLNAEKNAVKASSGPTTFSEASALKRLSCNATHGQHAITPIICTVQTLRPAVVAST